GPDAGDAGPADAGDAGCTALSIPTAGVIDNCIGSNVIGTASVSVTTPSCATIINSNTGTACNGIASTPADAFDGGCNSLPCRSTSLPGNLICTVGIGSSCTIT